jgi:hypothetical protein
MPFTKEQREIILKRDEYRCVWCGMGTSEGVELNIALLNPQNGFDNVANGVVMCEKHHPDTGLYNHKNLGKDIIADMLSNAEKSDDDKMILFLQKVLAVYEKHNINSQNPWYHKNGESDKK